LSSSGVRSKDGKPLSIDVAFMGTLASWRRIATLLQADLRAVGIDAELHGYTVPVFQGGGQTDVLHSGRFDIALTGFDNGSDPEQSEVFSCDQRSPGGSDSARYCDPEYDRAYAAQQRTLDRQARRAAFFRMQHILHDSYALDFIFTDAYHDVISTRVRGWAPNMLYRYSNAQDWDTN
jgi:ABC-type transport system substrate-binding protein